MATAPTVGESALPPGRAQSLWQRLQAGEELAHAIAGTAAAAIFVITALILYELISQSALSRQKTGWHFLVSSAWNPVTGDYGALPFMYGTVVTSLMALLIAVPLGVGAATFLSELAPAKISNALTFLIELLAA